jgi:N utilization substance protein A
VQRNLDVFGEKEWSEKDDETKAKITSPSMADLNQNRKAAR